MERLSTWELVLVLLTNSTSMNQKPVRASGPYMCTPNFVKRGGREKGKKKKRKEEERKEKGGGKFILWQCYDAIVLLVCG